MAYEVKLVVTIGYSPLRMTSQKELDANIEHVKAKMKETLQPLVGCWNGGGVKSVEVLNKDQPIH